MKPGRKERRKLSQAASWVWDVNCMGLSAFWGTEPGSDRLRRAESVPRVRTGGPEHQGRVGVLWALGCAPS